MSAIGKSWNISLKDGGTGDVLANANVNISTSLEVSINETLGRAGQEGAVQGVLYDSPDASLSFENFMWDLELIALRIGSAIEMDADVEKVETVIIGEANKIVAVNEVAPFMKVGTIGWYKLATEGQKDWKTIRFENNEATVAGLAVGTEICLKYPRKVVGSRQITVNTEMLPKIVHLTGTTPILSAGESMKGSESATRVGTLYVVGEKFQLNPSLTVTGGQSQYSPNPVSGRFLETSPIGCSSKPYLLKLIEEYDALGEFDNIKGLVVNNSMKEMSVGSELELEVLRYYGGMTLNKPVDDYSKLTIVSGDTAVATVSGNTVRAVKAGETVIEIIVTDKPQYNTSVSIEVS